MSFDERLAADIEQSRKDIENGNFIEFTTIAEFKQKLKDWDERNSIQK